MPNNLDMSIDNVPVSMLPLNMEEKVKVWTMFGESYKLSVFYVVGPVAIDSENIHKPKKRVEEVYIGTSQFERKKELKFETFIKEEDIDDEYTHRPDEDEDEEEEESDDYGSDDDDESSDDSDEDLSSDEDTDSEDSSEESEFGNDSESDDDGLDSESDSEESALGEENGSDSEDDISDDDSDITFEDGE